MPSREGRMMRTSPDVITRRQFVGRLGLVATAFILPRDAHPGANASARMHPGPKPSLEHPDPRPGITAERVLADGTLRSSKSEVLAAYAAARSYPAIFDGLACGCGCTEKGMPHRSLLVCYETQQPTGCWSCQKEAQLVADLAKNDTPLADIREAVDKKFG
jgi:hypothetical protein